MRAIRIPADSALPATIVDVELTLEYLQSAVGGYIEALDVDMLLTDHGRVPTSATVYLNEEGKLQQLPANSRATDLVALVGLQWGDYIAGDVIVVGQPDDDGETTAAPASVIRAVRAWGWCD